MRWRFWLMDLPAKAVDVWFLVYRFIFIIFTIVTVSMVLILLTMAALGIHWGW